VKKEEMQLALIVQLDGRRKMVVLNVPRVARVRTVMAVKIAHWDLEETVQIRMQHNVVDVN
jgi:hypothetical protein